MTQRPDMFVWTDIETTGLEVGEQVILEVGFVLTDSEFNTLDAQSWMLWDDDLYPAKVEAMPEFVRDMHTKNGLLEEAERRGVAPDDFVVEFTELVDDWKINGDDPLCGSSVQFDRAHLTFLADKPMGLFSYRNIDVSSFKETFRKRRPSILEELETTVSYQKLHRVLPDIDDTIGEYKFYLQKLGLL